MQNRLQGGVESHEGTGLPVVSSVMINNTIIENAPMSQTIAMQNTVTKPTGMLHNEQRQPQGSRNSEQGCMLQNNHYSQQPTGAYSLSGSALQSNILENGSHLQNSQIPQNMIQQNQGRQNFNAHNTKAYLADIQLNQMGFEQNGHKLQHISPQQNNMIAQYQSKGQLPDNLANSYNVNHGKGIAIDCSNSLEKTPIQHILVDQQMLHQTNANIQTHCGSSFPSMPQTATSYRPQSDSLPSTSMQGYSSAQTAPSINFNLPSSEVTYQLPPLSDQQQGSSAAQNYATPPNAVLNRETVQSFQQVSNHPQDQQYQQHQQQHQQIVQNRIETHALKTNLPASSQQTLESLTLTVPSQNRKTMVSV